MQVEEKQTFKDLLQLGNGLRRYQDLLQVTRKESHGAKRVTGTCPSCNTLTCA